MAESPVPERLRVLVAAPHAMVAEVVRAALANRGLDAFVIRWTAGGPDIPAQRPPPFGESLFGAGLILSSLDHMARLTVAVSIVKRVSVPWVVVTTSSPGPGWGAVLDAGARGVVRADVGLDELAELLAAAARHEVEFPPERRMELEAAWRVAQVRHGDVADRIVRLTSREREVLDLMREGASVANIAESFSVAPATVRCQVKAVLRKLDVNTQLAAGAALDGSLTGSVCAAPEEFEGPPPAAAGPP